MSISHSAPSMRQALAIALGLSLATAIALGFGRFSYALLLAPMRDDLGWSYLLAGAMNTANAVGYLLGALVTPLLLQRLGAQRVLLGGALSACLFLFGSALVPGTSPQLLLRLLAGLSSALIFVAGGLLSARLAALHPHRAGLLIGIYYGGTGVGIVLSSLLVPPAIALAPMLFGGAGGDGPGLLHGFIGSNLAGHGWKAAWMLLALLSLLSTVGLLQAARRIPVPPPQARGGSGFRPGDFVYALAGYVLFGAGYIGYMTFIVALLKQQGMSGGGIVVFYSLLGVGVIVSSRIWAGMLDRFRGGQSLAILCALLALATAIPALTASPPAIYFSGLLFGAVFLSVVASTTVLVRHNLPQSAWPGGIGAFTIVFALGQIIGPTVAGWVSDHSGSLRTGLKVSAAALLLGALLAWRQRALPHA